MEGRQDIKCPYCGAKAVLESSKKVYRGKDLGLIYLCINYPSCDAYVGVHKGTVEPKGRLANKALRSLKMEAHKYFDNLWQRKMRKEQIKKKEARKAGYLWLARELQVPFDECHIGMFNEILCQRVVDLCKPYYKV